MLFLIFSSALSQDASSEGSKQIPSFDKTYWEEQVKDLKYDKAEPDKKTEVEDKKFRRDFNGFEALGGIIKFIGILLLVGIVLFLLAHFLGFGANRKAENIKISSEGILTLDEIEDDIENVDINRQIEIALENKDFKLALRLQYLLVIQNLALENLIIYKKEKTNHAYLREINEESLISPFKHMTLFFEQYWYGDNILTEDVYYQYKEDYIIFNNHLATYHSSIKKENIDE